MFPMVIRRASLGEKNAGGLALRAVSRPLAARRLRNDELPPVSPLRRSSWESSGGTMSRRNDGTAALARCAAIALPHNAGPNTATRSIPKAIVYPIRRMSLLLKYGVIAREQRDRSNPKVLQDKYDGIAAHLPGTRNDRSMKDFHAHW